MGARHSSTTTQQHNNNNNNETENEKGNDSKVWIERIVLYAKDKRTLKTMQSSTH
jgi:hypothetical protein